MRILIITDSLGLPREEVKYKNVWTDMLLNKCLAENILYYTILKRALTIKELHEIKSNMGIGCLHPDLIIFQFGIVDAVRRVAPRWIENNFPANTKAIRHFIGKHRYQITKLYNFHYNSPKRFEQYLQNLVEWLEQRHRYYAFIKIAPPGDGLTSKIFNAETDVSTYNKILINTVKNWGPQGTVLDPYVGHNIEEFILADGHHLNPVGERLVFETVNNWIWSVAPAFAEEARKNL